MPDSEPKAAGSIPRRLCSEIQLFDLCDLDTCKHRSGSFCTDPVLLGRFEKIAEEELRAPERYVSEEFGDEDYDGDNDEDEFSTENMEEGEDSGWEDEE